MSPTTNKYSIFINDSFRVREGLNSSYQTSVRCFPLYSVKFRALKHFKLSVGVTLPASVWFCVLSVKILIFDDSVLCKENFIQSLLSSTRSRKVFMNKLSNDLRKKEIQLFITGMSDI